MCQVHDEEQELDRGKRKEKGEGETEADKVRHAKATLKSCGSHVRLLIDTDTDM